MSNRMENLLIRGAHIVNPGKNEDYIGDIAVSNGKITAMGQIGELPGARVIEAKGLVAAPGLVDMHVHLRDPGFTQKEDIFTGCRAAAAGGVTSLLAMPNTKPSTDSPETVEYILNKAKDADAHVYVAAAVTKGLKSQEPCDWSALAKAFVTPIDREDLAELSQNIDEVCDVIEEILQRFYVNQIQSATRDGILFAKKIAGCCRLMKDMLSELENFKKPEKLHSMIVELNHAEEECDAIYLESALRVRDLNTDVLEIVAWREIYHCMESCADACEHVADSVETIVMKNT